MRAQTLAASGFATAGVGMFAGILLLMGAGRNLSYRFDAIPLLVAVLAMFGLAALGSALLERESGRRILGVAGVLMGAVGAWALVGTIILRSRTMGVSLVVSSLGNLVLVTTAVMAALAFFPAKPLRWALKAFAIGIAAYAGLLLVGAALSLRFSEMILPGLVSSLLMAAGLGAAAVGLLQFRIPGEPAPFLGPAPAPTFHRQS